jgi:hypothetical protein
MGAPQWALPRQTVMPITLCRRRRSFSELFQTELRHTTVFDVCGAGARGCDEHHICRVTHLTSRRRIADPLTPTSDVIIARRGAGPMQTEKKKEHAP